MLNTPLLQNYLASAKSVSGQPKVRKALTWVLILACALMLVLMMRVILAQPPVIATDLQIKHTGPALRWNWFPNVRAPVASAPEPEQTDDEELARATIKAELLGVVITETISYAAISTSKNPQGVYSVGDQIENNVTLEDIQDYRVIVSQRGSRRQIPLKALEKGAKRSTAGKRASLIEVESSSSQSGSGFNLSGLVSTNPIRLPGGGIGLKLGGLSEDLTDLADVQEGDVVLSVNAVPVSELLTNPLLWQQFSQQTNMPITIRRGDEEIEMFVNAASLSAKILPRIGVGQVK